MEGSVSCRGAAPAAPPAPPRAADILHSPTPSLSIPPPAPPCCPSLPQAVPNAANKLSDADIDALTKRTQDGGTEVVQAKAGKVSMPQRSLGCRCCRRCKDQPLLLWLSSRPPMLLAVCGSRDHGCPADQLTHPTRP